VESDSRLPGNVRPLHYDLFLEIPDLTPLYEERDGQRVLRENAYNGFSCTNTRGLSCFFSQSGYNMITGHSQMTRCIHER